MDGGIGPLTIPVLVAFAIIGMLLLMLAVVFVILGAAGVMVLVNRIGRAKRLAEAEAEAENVW